MYLLAKDGEIERVRGEEIDGNRIKSVFNRERERERERERRERGEREISAIDRSPKRV